MKNLIFTLLLSLTYLVLSAQSGECVDGNCSDGNGTIVYQNGNKYRGSFKSGQRHGQGTFLWKSGASYVGTWKSGNRHGSGVYEYPDGARYDGNYANDKKNGQGTLYGPNGSVLQSGNWVNGSVSKSSSNNSNVVSNATPDQMDSYKDELGIETKYIAPKSKDRFLNVGYAFEPTFYPYFPSRGDLAPVFLSFELPVGESLRFRMGGFASYSTHQQKSQTLVHSWDWTNYTIGVLGAYYFDLIKSSKLDTYFQGIAGYNVSSSTYDSSSNQAEPQNDTDYSGLVGGLYIGSRYRFTDNFGLFIQGGYGLTYGAVGLTLRI